MERRNHSDFELISVDDARHAMADTVSEWVEAAMMAADGVGLAAAQPNAVQRLIKDKGGGRRGFRRPSVWTCLKRSDRVVHGAILVKRIAVGAGTLAWLLR